MKIAIISGKGGSGKSSVSAAFISLARRVVAVDCDVDASNLPLLLPHSELTREEFASGERHTVDPDRCIGCGVCISNCAYDALGMNTCGVAEANPLLCEACGLCERICPQQAITLEPVAESRICTSSFDHGILIHGELNPGDDNSGKMIARLRTIADDKMAEEGITLQILDGPPGIGCPVLSTVTGVDRVVIVCEPTLSGISDLQRAHKVASSFCDSISVIINKCDINEQNSSDITSLCSDLGVEIIARLPFDPTLVEAQIHCRSIIDHAPDCACATALRQAFEHLCRV